jgi:nucleoside-diphosphate-sugar epimerase
MLRKVLVTGGTGFVGLAVLRRLSDERGIALIAPVRRKEAALPVGVTPVFIEELSGKTDWLKSLHGVDIVVHCAARVHVMKEKAGHALELYNEVNEAGTVALARQSAVAGVKRFIFLSSIKVNGEKTALGHPFNAESEIAPADAYALSKSFAERALRLIAAQSGMEVVIIRPPLIYGPGVKANFKTMMRWIDCGMPLPFAGFDKNRRSLVAIENLIDLILKCLNHPAAANQTFLVSDGEDLSTENLVRKIGGALGKTTRLFYVPLTVCNLGAQVIKRRDMYQRLCDSLQVDIRKTEELLGWAPPISVDEALRKTAEAFRVQNLL